MNTKLPGRNTKTGSPRKGEPEYVLIGKLQRSHGVTGEIVLGIKTDFPERITRGKVVYLGGDHTPKKITGARPFNTNVLITLEGIHNREEASTLTNLEVFVRTVDLPALSEGRYYHHQLVGLQAVTEAGIDLGIVSEIMETGANDVYVVKNAAGDETLLPAIDSVILRVDLALKQIVVNPPEWE